LSRCKVSNINFNDPVAPARSNVDTAENLYCILALYLIQFTIAEKSPCA